MSSNELPLTPLTAVSPIDGRYSKQTAALRPYFSEHGLIARRVQVEIEYLIALAGVGLPGLPQFTPEQQKELRDIYQEFGTEWSEWIKAKETETNHDVKAVEYYVKHRITELWLWDKAEFVHFWLTSQDINNTATPLTLKEALQEVIIPQYEKVLGKIQAMAQAYSHIPMLARTHWQAATPTNLWKEMMVFVERLGKQIQKLKGYQFEWKFWGATGNFNAHHIAYPEVDWMGFADRFLQENLWLERQQYTTQIAHYDDIAELYQNMERANTILMDFAKDIWQYVSMDFFKQKTKADEIGSSAMPHKVNPIDFENAEWNLGLANAIWHHLAQKLPISRLQRDLTDSTVLRNTGVAFWYTLIALKSLERWIGKLKVNEAKILEDLDSHPLVIAEAIQTILRSIGYPWAYEALKNLTRWNTELTLEDIHTFIDRLEWVSDEIKLRLRAITPRNYTWIFPEIAKNVAK